jgi:hypothetical protein
MESEAPESPPLFGGGSVWEHAAEIPGGILRGFTGVGAAIPKAAALATTQNPNKDPRQSAMYRAGQAAEDWAAGVTGDANPRARFGAALGEGIGSVAAIIPAAIGAAYAAPAVGVGAGAGAALTAAGLGAASGAASAYDEARAMGADDTKARYAASLSGGLSAITEPLGVGGGRFAKVALGGIPSRIAREVVREGGEEAIQEAVQSAGGNVIARGLYDPERPVTQGVGESALIGGLVGGGFGGAGSALGSRRNARQAPPAPVPAPQPPPGPEPIPTKDGQGRPISVADQNRIRETREAAQAAQPDLVGVGPTPATPDPVLPAQGAVPTTSAPPVPEAPKAPESPLGKLGRVIPFGDEELAQVNASLRSWGKGMKVDVNPRGEAVLETPSGVRLHIAKLSEIPPEAFPGGPEMLASEIANNPGLGFQEGPVRGVTAYPKAANFKFVTEDGLEFDSDGVIAMSQTSDASTLPFEMFRWARQNLLTGAEQRRLAKDFPTEEAMASAYAGMVNSREAHPYLWRVREFFARLMDWINGRPGGESRAIMRDIASGKLWNRPGTAVAAGPQPRVPIRPSAPVQAPSRPQPPPVAPPIVAEDPIIAEAARMSETEREEADEAIAELMRQADEVRSASKPPAATPYEEAASAVPPASPVSTSMTTNEVPKAPPRPAKRVSKLAAPPATPVPPPSTPPASVKGGETSWWRDVVDAGDRTLALLQSGDEASAKRAYGEVMTLRERPKPPGVGADYASIEKGRKIYEAMRAIVGDPDTWALGPDITRINDRIDEIYRRLRDLPVSRDEIARFAARGGNPEAAAAEADGLHAELERLKQDKAAARAALDAPAPPVAPAGGAVPARATVAPDATVQATAPAKGRGDEAILNTKMPKGWEIGTVEIKRREEDGSIIGKTVNARVNKATGLAINAMPSDVTDALTYNVTDPESGMSVLSAPSVGKAHAGAELIAPYREFFRAYNKLLAESDEPTKKYPWVREFMSGFVELRRQFSHSNVTDAKRIPIPAEMIRGYKGAVEYLSSAEPAMPAPAKAAPKATAPTMPAPAKAAPKATAPTMPAPAKAAPKATAPTILGAKKGSGRTYNVVESASGKQLIRGVTVDQARKLASALDPIAPDLIAFAETRTGWGAGGRDASRVMQAIRAFRDDVISGKSPTTDAIVQAMQPVPETAPQPTSAAPSAEFASIQADIRRRNAAVADDARLQSALAEWRSRRSKAQGRKLDGRKRPPAKLDDSILRPMAESYNAAAPDVRPLILREAADVGIRTGDVLELAEIIAAEEPKTAPTKAAKPKKPKATLSENIVAHPKPKVAINTQDAWKTPYDEFYQREVARGVDSRTIHDAWQSAVWDAFDRGETISPAVAAGTHVNPIRRAAGVPDYVGMSDADKKALVDAARRSSKPNVTGVFQPAKEDARAPGGQGSFGFQPAKGTYQAVTESRTRRTEIDSWIKENVEPQGIENKHVTFRREQAAWSIGEYEGDDQNPFKINSAINSIRSYAGEVAKTIAPHDSQIREETKESISSDIADAFDVDMTEVPADVYHGWGDGYLVAYADSERGLIHLENKTGQFTVKAVRPDDLGPEHVVSASNTLGGSIDPDRLFDGDSEEGLASRVVGEDLSVDYFRAMSESPAILGVIMRETGAQNAYFQPKQRPQLHDRKEEGGIENAEKRTPKPDTVTMAGAARFAADAPAVEKMLLDAADSGRVLTDEENVAAGLLMSEVSRDAAYAPIGPEKMEKTARAVTLQRAYAKVGSEAGRSLRSRKLVYASEEDALRATILESLYDMTKAQAARFDKADAAGKKEIIAEVATNADAILAAAAKSGIDVLDAMTGNAASTEVDASIDGLIEAGDAAIRRFNTSSREHFSARSEWGKTKDRLKKLRAEMKSRAGEKKLPKSSWWRSELSWIKGQLAKFQPALAEGLDARFVPALKALADPSGLNPVTVKRVQRIAEAERATPGDMAREWWVNSILSGPQTQIVNVAGNVGEQLFSGLTRIPETVLAETARLLGIKSDGPAIGETREFYRAMLPGIQMGLRNGLRSWRIEDAVLANEYSVGRESHRAHAIPGRLGTVVRMPGRAMLVADEFFKGLAFRMAMGAEAWKIGKKQGLKGAALRSFVEKQSVNPSDAVADAAMKYAERVTFTQDPGKIARAVMDFREKVPGATYVIPFVGTPMNLLRTAVRRTPAGTANLAVGLAREMVARASKTPGGYRYETKYRDAVEQFIAWSALVLVAGAMGDEDDPIITGSKQFGVDKKGEIDLAYRSAPPQSIKIGGKWYSYARADPFATALTLMVDGLRAQGKTKDASEAMSRLMRSTLGIVSNATFLQGLSDVLEMVTQGGDVKRWAENFAVSWVPNIVRQPARAFEPNILEKRDQPFREVVKQGAFPAVRGALVPKVDLWGRDVESSSLGMNPATDIPFRILSPVRVQPEASGAARELDRTIVRYNMMNPASAWYPTAPPSKFSDGRGGEIALSPTEYHDFLRDAGKEALRRLSNLKPLPDDAPPRAWESRIAGIKRALDDSRADARKRIVAKKRRDAIPSSPERMRVPQPSP